MIIITKKNVNDLNIFYIILIVKIKIAFIIISKLFKLNIVDLKIIINKIYEIIFIKNDFSEKRRNCIIII